jgi:tRNA dimethylallyltransferase
VPALIDPGRVVAIFLDADRQELHRRIDGRFDSMLAEGALDEVRALDSRNLDPLSPALKAHGVPWLRQVLAGTMTLAEAAEAAKRDTRRYTKRQRTWFRHQLPDFVWIAPEQAEQHVHQALNTVSS